MNAEPIPGIFFVNWLEIAFVDANP